MDDEEMDSGIESKDNCTLFISTGVEYQGAGYEQVIKDAMFTSRAVCENLVMKQRLNWFLLIPMTGMFLPMTFCVSIKQLLLPFS